MNYNNSSVIVPVCVCGHAKNLHKYGSVDCNGTHGGGAWQKPRKCPCMLFTDKNKREDAPVQQTPPQTVAPHQAYWNETRQQEQRSAPVAPEVNKRALIEAQMKELKEQLESMK